MPDTFIDFKKQRFRWAYGAIQIIKRHASSLLRGKDSQLTRGQRYHFLAGWLPWVADGMNIFFTVGALLWSAAMIIVPTRVDPPLLIFAIPPLALFVFKVGKIIFLYRRTVGVNLKDAFAAALAGLALSHTIAKAVLYGFFTTSIPFFRTPKNADNHGFLGRALRGTGRSLHHAVALGRSLGDLLRTRVAEQRHALLGGDVAGAIAAVSGSAGDGLYVISA